MDRRARDARSPASDTDGSEDVFLDLLNDDGDDQDPASRATPRDNDFAYGEEDRTLRDLPGQFPGRTTRLEQDPRPRSSGHVMGTTTAAGQEHSARMRHARHVSTPNGASSYANNLAAFRQNREQQSSAYYQATADTPRLRRQRRLYADIDGHIDYRRESTTQASPLQQSPMSHAVQNDSDSVGSQKTAASTVWDELDDLKSRIKKLETTGRLPATANAVIANHASVRPRTATTAPTTVSSSPKQARKQEMLPTETVNTSGISAEVHPTLHSALARAKTVLKPHVFRPLEASVLDALTMATATGRQNTSTIMSSAGSTINGLGTSDRQMRRKVDGLCRNLADLCIAMCDSRTEETPPTRSPIDPRKTAGSLVRHYDRSVTDHIDATATPSSMQSRRGSRTSWIRAEDHKTPRIGVGGRDDLADDIQAVNRSPSTTPKDYAARYSSLGRSDATLRSRRASRADATEDTTFRAPSRAMTEVGRLGIVAKREHLTSAATRSPSLRETLEARRRSGNFGREEDINETQSSVGITGQTPAARRFLERVRGTPSEVGSSVVGARPRMSSQDYHTPSPNITTPLARSSSISQRRFAT
ncbi:hypothetical protein CAC42_5264 [Sphaceloma murrayae]|uniref:Uncharacterized protein n=1 Tax=Sphaceloma murrayae TaxID=2082308 RepID=A0A2K1QUI6_9PEZI|nr:hypothetical protein CAC42_5264 [Sphaceloma murrayae]